MARGTRHSTFTGKRRWRVAGGLVLAGLLAATVGALAGPGAATTNAHFECLKRPTTTSEGTPNTALLRTLGVLRRSPTAADALPAESPPSPVGLGEGVYVKYVRLARTVAGTSYYLFPVAKGCSSLGEEVVLENRGPGGFGGTGGNTLAQIKHGTSLTTVGKSTSTASGVVPDKVARVVLIYARSAVGSKRRRAVKVSATVINNVFVATVPLEPGLAIQPSRIVWRSAKGSVIRTFRRKP
jgi:hypothetical protein